ncbi:hypothetical protein PGB90_009256 [Kerria lacca]
MTTEQKFNAAVNVIRNLPKNGPAQPSHHIMLKFYAYFKQATEGPNASPKPPFWDIVKKAKWDAWSKLGNMDRETAMKLYVEEFKKIVDTISSSNINYDKSEVDSFYASVPIDDLELLIGPKLARSRPNSPTNELNKSNTQNMDTVKNSVDKNEVISNIKGKVTVNDENNQVNYNDMNEPVYTNVSIRAEDEEDDEFFLDTIENSDHGSVKSRVIVDRNNTQFSCLNGYAMRVADDRNNNNPKFYAEDPETSLQLTKVIVCLQKDLEKVVKSVNMIEQRMGQLQGKIVEQNSPFSHILTSPFISFVVLFTWPVMLQLLLFWFRRRK